MKKLTLFLAVLLLVVGGMVQAGDKVEVTIPYHVRMDQLKDGQDINDNLIVNKMHEVSGIDFELESLPKTNGMQTVILKLASGDVPDLLFLPSMNGKADFFKLARQGLFAPVNDLMEEYAPNYIKAVPEEVRNSMNIDGKTYGTGIYYYRWFKYNIAVRTDFLEELNLEAPETLEEYYQVMKEIKNKKDVVPLTLDGADPEVFFQEVSPISGAYGLANPTLVKDGKLVFSWIQPEYKEFITYLKKLYDEGLLDKELALNQVNTAKNKLSSGNYAMGIVPWYQMLAIDSTVAKLKDGAEVKMIQSPIGPDGQYGVIDYSAIKYYVVIPAQADNKEGAAKFINYIYSDEQKYLGSIGIEGEHYNIVNGKVEFTDKHPEVASYISYLDLKPNMEISEISWDKGGHLKYVDQLKEGTKVQKNIMYNAPPIDDYNDNLKTLLDFAYENTIKFIMGAKPMSEFDDYVVEFNRKGGSEAIDAANEWFISWNK